VAAGWLVDTNVISELRRRSPDANVQTFFAKRPAAERYLSVLTLGEIRKGVEALADPGRRIGLRQWLERELPVFFAERVLPIDAGVAHQWGQLAGRHGPAPQPGAGDPQPQGRGGSAGGGAESLGGGASRAMTPMTPRAAAPGRLPPKRARQGRWGDRPRGSFDVCCLP